MHLPFQKVKKNIAWGRYITDIFSFTQAAHTFLLAGNQLIQAAHTFLVAGNQFIFCKEEVVATFV